MLVVSSLLLLFSIHTADLCKVIKPIKQHELIGHVIKTMQDTSFEMCTYRCELDVTCYSVNFHTNTGRCEFNYGSKEMFPEDFKRSRDTLYIHNIRKDARDPCRLLYCLHGGSCYPLPQPYCVCTADFAGSRCQNISKLKLSNSCSYLSEHRSKEGHSFIISVEQKVFTRNPNAKGRSWTFANNVGLYFGSVLYYSREKYLLLSSILRKQQKITTKRLRERINYQILFTDHLNSN